MERDKGVNHDHLARYASSLTPYVRDHLARAAQGIEELYAALPSDLTPEDEQRSAWEDGRAEYVDRICESIQHLGAALTAVGCTDDELKRIIVCEEVANEVKRDGVADSSKNDECASENEFDTDAHNSSVSSVDQITDVPEAVK
jgi:hypothetical protein